MMTEKLLVASVGFAAAALLAVIASRDVAAIALLYMVTFTVLSLAAHTTNTTRKG